MNDLQKSSSLALIIPLFAAILPFVVWPIEYLFPYPFVIEEVAKALLIYPLLVLVSLTDKIKLVVIVGILFALSESVLFIFNILLVGDASTIFLRLLLTIPLHVFTALIILLFANFDRALIIVGVICSACLHFIYNHLIGTF